MPVGTLTYGSPPQYVISVGGDGDGSGTGASPAGVVAYTDSGANTVTPVTTANALPVRVYAAIASVTESTFATVGGTAGPFAMGDSYRSFSIQAWITGGIVTNVNYVDIQLEYRNSTNAQWMPVGSVERIDCTVAGDKSTDWVQAFNYFQLRLNYLERNGTGTAPTINYSVRLVDI